VGRRSRRSEIVDYFGTMWPNFPPGRSSARVERILISGDQIAVFAEFIHTAAATGRGWGVRWME
jgi:hypothetical protein